MNALLRRIMPAFVALAVLAACSPTGEGGGANGFASTDITGANYAKGFQLTDHTGAPRSLADYRGKVVTLFFGYTQCPDVCPTNLLGMAEVMRQLGAVIRVTRAVERPTPDRRTSRATTCRDDLCAPSLRPVRTRTEKPDLRHARSSLIPLCLEGGDCILLSSFHPIVPSL